MYTWCRISWFKSNLPFNSNLPIRPSSIDVVSSNESLTVATLSSTATIAKFSSTSVSCCSVNVPNMAAIYEITEHEENTTFHCNKMPWQICLDGYVPSSFSSRVKSLSSWSTCSADITVIWLSRSSSKSLTSVSRVSTRLFKVVTSLFVAMISSLMVLMSLLMLSTWNSSIATLSSIVLFCSSVKKCNFIRWRVVHMWKEVNNI